MTEQSGGTSDGVLVRVGGVDKVYKRGSEAVHVLADLSVEVRQGEFLALMGPSGSGKSTLLNLIGGLDRPSKGFVIVGDERIDELADRELAAWRARHVGFVFQLYNLLPVLNALENVELPLLLGGRSTAEARRRALRALEVVGLENRLRHRPSELSGGQQQRVAIARALAPEPAVIFADEPTGNLDTDSAKDIMQLIVQLNRENAQTFVLVTHAREVAAVASRIVRMRDGEIVSE